MKEKKKKCTLIVLTQFSESEISSRQSILDGEDAGLCFQEIALKRGGDTVKPSLQVSAFFADLREKPVDVRFFATKRDYRNNAKSILARSRDTSACDCKCKNGEGRERASAREWPF